MKHFNTSPQETAFDMDDFATIMLLNRIETGEHIDNEEFTQFVKKLQDLVSNLRRLVSKHC